MIGARVSENNIVNVDQHCIGVYFRFGCILAAVKAISALRCQCDDIYCDNLNLKLFNGTEEKSFPSKFSLRSDTIKVVTSDDKMIEFHIDCPSSKNSTMEMFCDNVSRSFKLAGNYISNILELKVPVTVQAKVFSFCKSFQYGTDSSSKSICSPLLGSGRSSSFYTITGGEKIPVDALYPSALTKQLINDKWTSSKYDIEMNFNSDINFFFSQDSSSSIQADQYDFLFVSVHELLHGFGISSAWNINLGQSFIYQKISPSFEQKYTLVPESISDTLYGGNRFIGTIFDYYLVSSTPEGTYRWKSAIPALKEGLLSMNYDEKSLENALLISHNMYKDATSVRFAYPSKIFGIQNDHELSSWDTVMDTNSYTFQSGTSLVHLDRTYMNGNDFLMAPFLTSGVTLNSRNSKDPLFPIGIRATGILMSMGYEVKGKVDKLVARGLYNSSASRSKVSIVSVVIMLLASWFVLL